ncbi:unnamed protein product, partial [marine sediment metagenome]
YRCGRRKNKINQILYLAFVIPNHNEYRLYLVPFKANSYFIDH